MQNSEQRDNGWRPQRDGKRLQVKTVTDGIITSVHTLLVVMKPDGRTNVEAAGVHYHQ